MRSIALHPDARRNPTGPISQVKDRLRLEIGLLRPAGPLRRRARPSSNADLRIEHRQHPLIGRCWKRIGLRQRTGFRFYRDPADFCIYAYLPIPVLDPACKQVGTITLAGALSIGVPDLLDQQRIGGKIPDDSFRLRRVLQFQILQALSHREDDTRIAADRQDLVPRFRRPADKPSVRLLAGSLRAIAGSRDDGRTLAVCPKAKAPPPSSVLDIRPD